MSSDYSSDGFRTLTLRYARGAKSAVAEGLRDIHYGDSVSVVLRGCQGLDPDTAVVGCYSPNGVPIAAVTQSLRRVPDADIFYVILSFRTDACAAAVAQTPVGDAVEARLFVADAVRTWADHAFQLYANPAIADGGGDVPVSGFVSVASLRALAAAVAELPADTPARREARFAALLAGLLNL